MRRNAGTIRTLFDEPAIGAGIEELRADLEDAVAAGLLPAHDSEYMAAAMVGAGHRAGADHVRTRAARRRGRHGDGHPPVRHWSARRRLSRRRGGSAAGRGGKNAPLKTVLRSPQRNLGAF